MVTLPRQQDIDPSQYPTVTVVAWLVMSALVSGFVEETAFRGYVQSGIERRHGVTTAILVTGSLFALSHFNHPEVGVVLLPFYLAVAAADDLAGGRGCVVPGERGWAPSGGRRDGPGIPGIVQGRRAAAVLTRSRHHPTVH